jgi:outer membrane protein assembly factor BamB
VVAAGTATLSARHYPAVQAELKLNAGQKKAMAAFQAEVVEPLRSWRELDWEERHRRYASANEQAKKGLPNILDRLQLQRLSEIDLQQRGCHAVYATALNYQGTPLWQTKVSDYVLNEGYASSPAIYKSLVIVAVDSKGGGALAGLDRATGNIRWTTKRPALPNYASPIILEAAGREQLLLPGCDLVSSFDPHSGNKLWEIDGATTECVTSMVTDGNLVFTSGGYPRQHVSALRADGSGKIAWENKSRVYVPSMVVRDGYLYAIIDAAGMAVCWACDTGKEMWKARLGGTFSASLVLVGTHLYAVNEAGKMFIFKAVPKAFELVAENKLGDEVMATPAICGGCIFMRVADTSDGRRQEWMYCLGER